MASSELSAPDKAGATVLDRFAVDQIADLTWRGRDCDPLGGRMYGGTLAARLLAAARAATVGPPATSGLDIHFLQPADGGLPVDYHVERAHDGRSSAVRRVTATQHGRTVAVGTVSFHTPRDGWSHGRRDPGEKPDGLPAKGLPHRARAVRATDFDIRYHDESTQEHGVVRRLWFRALEDLPAAVAVHECVLTFLSDIYFFEPICLEHGCQGNDRRIRYGTTQHAMWFHQRPVLSDWLLIESRSPALAGGRGLVYGEVRTVGGDPVATIVQEVAIGLTPA